MNKPYKEPYEVKRIITDDLESLKDKPQYTQEATSLLRRLSVSRHSRYCSDSIAKRLNFHFGYNMLFLKAGIGNPKDKKMRYNEKEAPINEILESIYCDLHQRGLSIDDFREVLSTTEQAAAVLSGKRYFTSLQAVKLRKIYGYNYLYLCFGQGKLKDEIDSPTNPNEVGGVSENIHSKKVELDYSQVKIFFLERVIKAWGHPTALKVLDSFKSIESSNSILTADQFSKIKEEVKKLEMEDQQLHQILENLPEE